MLNAKLQDMGIKKAGPFGRIKSTY